MSKLMIVAAATAVAALSATAHASESERIKVRSLLCSESQTCTAYFASGQVAAGTTCERTTGNAVRWDASTPAGANMLSLLLAAHLANKDVIIWDSGCIFDYPKLAYLQVF